MAEPEQFDWSDSRLVVVKRVDPIAVQKNSDGDIVIRQQRVDLREDVIVIVPLEQASRFVEGLQRVLKSPAFTPPPITGVLEPSAIPPV